MDSVKSARQRLKAYPQVLASCGPEAAAYGKCVGLWLGEVKKDQCKQEFVVFMDCVRKSATKIGTKL